MVGRSGSVVSALYACLTTAPGLIPDGCKRQFCNRPAPTSTGSPWADARCPVGPPAESVEPRLGLVAPLHTLETYAAPVGLPQATRLKPSSAPTSPHSPPPSSPFRPPLADRGHVRRDPCPPRGRDPAAMVRDKAIARTTPALLGLYSPCIAMGMRSAHQHQHQHQHQHTIRHSVVPKTSLTFSDAIGAVRLAIRVSNINQLSPPDREQQNPTRAD
jgi:hypothetical protein